MAPRVGCVVAPTWPSGTARRLEILRDGFDSRLELIAFDIYIGWLTSQSPSIIVEFSVQYNLKINVGILFFGELVSYFFKKVGALRLS